MDSGNIGSFYRYANNKLSYKSQIGQLQQPDGSFAIDPQHKAELLQHVFSSNFTSDNNVIPPHVNTNLQNHKLSNILFLVLRL